MLTRALEDGNFDSLVDKRIQYDHNQNEMARMVACAAACVRHSARRRPRMSQVKPPAAVHCSCQAQPLSVKMCVVIVVSLHKELLLSSSLSTECLLPFIHKHISCQMPT